MCLCKPQYVVRIYQAAAELQSRLPRLIFAALDTFPLADGREAGGVRLGLSRRYSHRLTSKEF